MHKPALLHTIKEMARPGESARGRRGARHAHCSVRSTAMEPIDGLRTETSPIDAPARSPIPSTATHHARAPPTRAPRSTHPLDRARAGGGQGAAPLAAHPRVRDGRARARAERRGHGRASSAASVAPAQPSRGGLPRADPRADAQVVPLLIGGREVLACAPTGPGKTVAFQIPMLARLGAGAGTT